eukprot:sb/3464838/
MIDKCELVVLLKDLNKRCMEQFHTQYKTNISKLTERQDLPLEAHAVTRWPCFGNRGIYGRREKESHTGEARGAPQVRPFNNQPGFAGWFFSPLFNVNNTVAMATVSVTMETVPKDALCNWGNEPFKLNSTVVAMPQSQKPLCFSSYYEGALSRRYRLTNDYVVHLQLIIEISSVATETQNRSQIFDGVVDPIVGMCSMIATQLDPTKEMIYRVNVLSTLHDLLSTYPDTDRKLESLKTKLSQELETITNLQYDHILKKISVPTPGDCTPERLRQVQARLSDGLCGSEMLWLPVCTRLTSLKHRNTVWQGAAGQFLHLYTSLWQQSGGVLTKTPDQIRQSNMNNLMQSLSQARDSGTMINDMKQFGTVFNSVAQSCFTSCVHTVTEGSLSETEINCRALRSFAAKSRIVIAPSFQLQSKNDPQVFERSRRDLPKT